ncbi:hypothetical protein Y1Q_0023361 [Alligator mississippiensis]|uniref:Uncharacterized protein n=1 Tax=Alligator mississippiensis TaxID=8496 RepID=A0A151NP65_ALLMI|nr:hypothetical protein Y1Q_0023361 [Alligator mississippiensis]
MIRHDQSCQVSVWKVHKREESINEETSNKKRVWNSIGVRRKLSSGEGYLKSTPEEDGAPPNPYTNREENS